LVRIPSIRDDQSVQVGADGRRSGVRLAGRGRSSDGSVVTWTVADGSKGRRWREVVVRAGAIVHSLLLETFPDGRFAHLELSTPAGLLTLHPEHDGTLHGNAVTEDRVRHVRGLPWSDRSILLVDGSILARTAAAALGSVPESSIVVGVDLSVEVRAVKARDLEIAPGADRLPVLEAGESWPLELDD
jgi:hypothetical protein